MPIICVIFVLCSCGHGDNMDVHEGPLALDVAAKVVDTTKLTAIAKLPPDQVWLYTCVIFGIECERTTNKIAFLEKLQDKQMAIGYAKQICDVTNSYGIVMSTAFQRENIDFTQELGDDYVRVVRLHLDSSAWHPTVTDNLFLKNFVPVIELTGYGKSQPISPDANIEQIAEWSKLVAVLMKNGLYISENLLSRLTFHWNRGSHYALFLDAVSDQGLTYTEQVPRSAYFGNSQTGKGLTVHGLHRDYMFYELYYEKILYWSPNYSVYPAWDM